MIWWLWNRIDEAQKHTFTTLIKYSPLSLNRNIMKINDGPVILIRQVEPVHQQSDQTLKIDAQVTPLGSSQQEVLGKDKPCAFSLRAKIQTSYFAICKLQICLHSSNRPTIICRGKWVPAGQLLRHLNQFQVNITDLFNKSLISLANLKGRNKNSFSCFNNF